MKTPSFYLSVFFGGKTLRTRGRSRSEIPLAQGSLAYVNNVKYSNGLQSQKTLRSAGRPHASDANALNWKIVPNPGSFFNPF
jgi:hypothetical protein